MDDRTTRSGRRTARQPFDAAEEFLRSWAREDAAGPVDRSGAHRPVRRRLERRRVVLVSALLVVALGGLGLVVSHLLSENLGSNVARVPDVFAPLDPATRPAESRSLTFLLAGADSRSASPGTGSTVTGAGGRGDVLMIARLNPDRTAAAVAAIPRDSWVDIPHHGFDRIDAAYALGGPTLLIATVENLTSIRIDQFAVIDFAGIQAMVDAVGGIDVAVGTATSNDGVTFRAGANHLDGRGALAYVGPRDGSSDGDLDRAQRQQNALRALVNRVAEQGTLTSPAGTYELLDAASHSVSVDDTLSNGGLRSIASTLHDIDPTALTFVSAPVAALGRERDEPVVYLDDASAADLWTALSEDRVAAYAAAHSTETLGAETR
jgi:LCP family protein required for cell wall assembly